MEFFELTGEIEAEPAEFDKIVMTDTLAPHATDAPADDEALLGEFLVVLQVWLRHRFLLAS